jgi:hypothetical protein
MTIRPTFNQGRPLSEDDLHRVAPSIFGDTASPARSEKFKPIATIEVLRGLANEGFFPVSVQEQGSRSFSRRPFTKHVVRLRRFDETRDLKVNDTIAEVVLKNANDGTAAYSLNAGLFRIACLNGAVIQTEEFGAERIAHIGERATMDKVIEGSYKIINRANEILEAPRDWSKLMLPSSEAYSLAMQVHHRAFKDADDVVRTPIKVDQLLGVRRAEDKGQDLWTIFNVIQENVLRGGLEADSVTTTERWGTVRTHVRTHAINAIDRSMKLNIDIFNLASDTYKKLSAPEEVAA